MAGKQKFKEDVIGALTKFSTVTVQLANSLVTLGGLQYNTGVLSLSTNINGAGGLDAGSVQANKVYSTFVVDNSGTLALVASLSDSPSGFTAFKKVGSFNTVAAGAVNGASEKDEGSVGDTKYSMLTEEAFIAEHGGGWVLADGRDVSGSRFQTLTGNAVVPDGRGQFLRAKNNGRTGVNADQDGERSLGDTKQDKMQGHQHISPYINSGSTIYNGSQGAVFGGTNTPNGFFVTANNRPALYRTDPFNSSGNETPRVGDETAPKNIAMNLFIKIN